MAIVPASLYSGGARLSVYLGGGMQSAVRTGFSMCFHVFLTSL
jgi:hypothetical protein